MSGSPTIVITTILIALSSLVSASTPTPGTPLKWEFGVRSTGGAWIIQYVHNYYPGPWGYTEDKIAHRTSDIGFNFRPQVTVTRKSLFAAASAEFGNYSYAGGGTSSFSALDFEFGYIDMFRRGMGRLSVAYQRFEANYDGLNTLFRNHTVSKLGIRTAISSKPENSFRWRWVATIPFDMFTFSGVYLTEHQQVLSFELTFGFKPRRSPIFVDVGYYAFLTQKPLQVFHKYLVRNLQSIRHGVVLTIGYAKI